MAGTDSEERKYVHIEGRAEIRYDSKLNKLVLTFLDEHFNPIDPAVPIVFSNLAIKVKHLHLVASLSKEGYDLYSPTLKKIDPLLEAWNELENSNNSGDMNTTDPPTGSN